MTSCTSTYIYVHVCCGYEMVEGQHPHRQHASSTKVLHIPGQTEGRLLPTRGREEEIEDDYLMDDSDQNEDINVQECHLKPQIDLLLEHIHPQRNLNDGICEEERKTHREQKNS